jgi:hypothetical protein
MMSECARCGEQMQVATFRCRKCGYLESYAKA